MVYIRKGTRKGQADFTYGTWNFGAWSLKEAYLQMLNRFKNFNIHHEYALFTSKGNMIFASSAFHRDFDYDLAVAAKGKKVDYVEDYKDEWSQYMMGIAFKFGWIQVDAKQLGNKWTIVSLSKDGSAVEVE